MTSRRGTRLGLSLVGLAVLLGGCGAAEEAPEVATAIDRPEGQPAAPDAADDPLSADEAAQARLYADCLAGEGVVMEVGDTGAPQIDKDKTPVSAVGAAQEACREHAPSDDAPEALSAADLEQRRTHAACMRENGVGAFADPDPLTGAVSEEAAAQIRGDEDLAAALEVCRDARVQPGAETSG